MTLIRIPYGNRAHKAYKTSDGRFYLYPETDGRSNRVFGWRIDDTLSGKGWRFNRFADAKRRLLEARA